MVHLLKLRREDGADGAGVHAAIGMASGLTVDGAGVLAGGATNAVEGLSGFAVCEDFGAGVVHQDDMEILRAIAWMDAGPDGVVRVHALAGGGAWEELQHDFEVLKAGQDLIDAGDGDQGVRQGEAHAAVAFAFDDADAAGFGDEEVCAADAGFDAQKFFAQEEARGVGEIFGAIAKVGEMHLALKYLANLLAVFMQGGDHDVGGAVVAELDDELGEIGLVGMNSLLFESWVEGDLFGGHRFNLDDFVGARGLDEVKDDGAGFGCVLCPMHDSAGACAVGFKLLQVDVEILQGVLTDLLAGFAKLLPVGHLADDARALGLNDVGGVMDVVADLLVFHGGAGRDGERGRSFGIERSHARGVTHWPTSGSPARISAR